MGCDAVYSGHTVSQHRLAIRNFPLTNRDPPLLTPLAPGTPGILYDP